MLQDVPLAQQALLCIDVEPSTRCRASRPWLVDPAAGTRRGDRIAAMLRQCLRTVVVPRELMARLRRMPQLLVLVLQKSRLLRRVAVNPWCLLQPAPLRVQSGRMAR